MASVSDVRYKQRVVIEFLTAEKETVGNIHKRLCTVYGESAVDRSMVSCWAQRVRPLEGGSVVRDQNKEWYRQGIHALVSRWRKAIERDGDYVEK